MEHFSQNLCKMLTLKKVIFSVIEYILVTLKLLGCFLKNVNPQKIMNKIKLQGIQKSV